VAGVAVAVAGDGVDDEAALGVAPGEGDAEAELLCELLVF